MMTEHYKKKQDFIDEFNVDSPWDNPVIEDVIKNMVTIFVEESVKLYNNNDMSYSNKKHLKYTYVTKGYVTNPIKYILSGCKMFTSNVNAINHIFHYKNNENKNIGCDSHEFNYTDDYKSIIHDKLSNILEIEDISGEDTACKLFEERCIHFYHQILEYYDMQRYAFFNNMFKNPLHSLYNDGGDETSKYFQPETIDIFNKTFAVVSDNVSINANDNTMCRGQKNMARVEEQKKLLIKIFCDVVGYGYMAEKVKLTKLKNVKSYANVVADIKIIINNTERGSGVIVHKLLSEMLENADIKSLKNTKIEPIWSDLNDCFMFMLKTINNLLVSETLLTKLQNVEPSLTTTDTVKRITDLQNEIKSSKNYIQKVFLQFIHHMIREMSKEDYVSPQVWWQ